MRITDMLPGTFMLLPGGWLGEQDNNLVFYFVERKADSYSFAVINTGGPGMEYHPLTTESNMEMKYKAAIVADGILQSVTRSIITIALP